jgi:hypothetical protein
MSFFAGAINKYRGLLRQFKLAGICSMKYIGTLQGLIVRNFPGVSPGMNHQALSSFISSVADLLRCDYTQSEYGKVTLPALLCSLPPAPAKSTCVA